MYFNYLHTLVMSVNIEMCEGSSTTISSVSTESSVESGNNDNSKCKLVQ